MARAFLYLWAYLPARESALCGWDCGCSSSHLFLRSSSFASFFFSPLAFHWSRSRIRSSGILLFRFRPERGSTRSSPDCLRILLAASWNPAPLRSCDDRFHHRYCCCCGDSRRCGGGLACCDCCRLAWSESLGKKSPSHLRTWRLRCCYCCCLIRCGDGDERAGDLCRCCCRCRGERAAVAAGI